MKKLIIIITICMFTLSSCSSTYIENDTFEVNYITNQYNGKIVSKDVYNYSLSINEMTNLTNMDKVSEGDILYTSYYEEIDEQTQEVNRNLNYAYVDLDEIENNMYLNNEEISSLNTDLENLDENDLNYEIDKNEISIQIESLEADNELLEEQDKNTRRTIEGYNQSLNTLTAEEQVIAPFSGKVYIDQNILTLYSNDVLLQMQVDSNMLKELQSKENLYIQYDDSKYYINYNYYEVDDLSSTQETTMYNIYFDIIDFNKQPLLDEDVVVHEVDNNLYIPEKYLFYDLDDKPYVNINNEKKYVSVEEVDSRIVVTEGLEVGDVVLSSEVNDDQNK